MAGFTLVPTLKDVKSLDDARKILTEITKGNKFSNTGAKRLVSIHRKMTRMAFSKQEDPDTGEKWAEPRRRTTNDSRFKGLLTRSKALYKAATKPDVTYKAEEGGGVTATVRMPGSPPYAEFQQFGTSRVGPDNSWAGPDVFVNDDRKTVETVYRRKNGIPARPFFAFARDSFSNKQVARDVEDTLQVIFDSISKSFEKKALSLPADEIEGYTSVVSFYTRTGTTYTHAGGGYGVSSTTKSGRNRLTFTGVRPRGFVAREATIGRFNAKRTLKHRPPIKSRRSDARSARYATYMQLKKNYEMHMRELRMDIRERYAELLRNSEEMATNRFKELATNLATQIENIQAQQGMSTDDKAELILKLKLGSGIIFMRNGSPNVQKTMARLRRQLVLLEAREIRKEFRAIARDRAGFKSPGRKPDPPDVKARKHQEELARRRAAAAASAEERREKRRKVNEAVKLYLSGERRSVPRNKDVIKRFYEKANDTNFAKMEEMFEQAKKLSKQVGEEAFRLHAVEFRRAEKRVMEWRETKKRNVERRLAQLEERRKKLLATKEAKKLLAQQERERKKQEQANNPPEPKPAKPRAASTMKITIKGEELTAAQKAQNADISKQLSRLRNMEKAMNQAGNQEMVKVIQEQRKALEGKRHKRQNTTLSANQAQREEAHMFRRRTAQVQDTARRVHDLKVAARDLYAAARRQGNFDQMKVYDAEAKRLSDLERRLGTHTDVLARRWQNLTDASIKPNRPVLGPPSPFKVEAAPKKAPKPKSTAKASTTPKPKKTPKKSPKK